jgi:hypothetical protein
MFLCHSELVSESLANIILLKGHIFPIVKNPEINPGDDNNKKMKKYDIIF